MLSDVFRLLSRDRWLIARERNPAQSRFDPRNVAPDAEGFETMAVVRLGEGAAGDHGSELHDPPLWRLDGNFHPVLEQYLFDQAREQTRGVRRISAVSGRA